MQFSKGTIKILKVFYENPKQQFYIQELGRILKRKPGVFQRTLYNLQKEGVLTSCYKANARFFSANKKYPFYKEFKSIVRKSAGIAVLIIFLNALLSPADCAEAQKTLKLSGLKEAIELAFKNNKDIKIQEYELKTAEANILGAKSAFLPSVDYNAGYTHNGAALKLNTATGKKDIGVFTGYADNNQMGISASQTVYSGGAITANLRQTQLGLTEQKETLRAIKLNVELEAKRLYYGLLLAYETKRIAEDLVRQAEEHYQKVKHNYEQGTSSKFDVLQSKVQVSLLMPQLINAQNAIDITMAELNKLLGLKISDIIEANDKLGYAPFEIREDTFLKEAYLNQPEMNLKSLGIDINKWAIKYAKAGWFPQVEANSQYYYQSNNLSNMFNSRHNNWDIGLSIRLSIFDGFSTRAKVNAARAKYEQSIISKENLADQVAVDVKQACLDLKEASAVIQSQLDNLEDAKEALRLSYVRYDNGVGINLDVLDAQVSEANVEKNLVEGKYDYIMAKARLDRAMGRGFIEEAK